MHLTDLNVVGAPYGHSVAHATEKGVSIPVSITKAGVFQASFNGEDYEDESLDRLGGNCATRC